MRYWDASAIVPLLVQESASEWAYSHIKSDGSVVTWYWTVVEIRSAIERRMREGQLPRPDYRRLVDRLNALASEWDEVADGLAVRQQAVNLLGRHALRAADAGQLAAAQLVAEHNPASLEFVCLDRRLSEAAEREGFRVLSP